MNLKFNKFAFYFSFLFVLVALSTIFTSQSFAAAKLSACVWKDSGDKLFDVNSDSPIGGNGVRIYRKSDGKEVYFGSTASIPGTSCGCIGYTPNIAGVYEIVRLQDGWNDYVPNPAIINYNPSSLSNYVVNFPVSGTTGIGTTFCNNFLTPTPTQTQSSWWQAQSFDARFDNGIILPIPPTTSPSCGAVALTNDQAGGTASTGVFFQGDNLSSFGSGRVSTKGWLVGGQSYPETYKTNTTSISVSYTYLKALIGRRLSFKSLPCNTTSCRLPATLTSGVYHVDGSVNFKQVIIPVKQDIIILAGKNVRIENRMQVPIGSTLLIAAKDSITFSDLIPGSPPSCSATKSTDADISGWFSAERNITFEGSADCTRSQDTMLSVSGAIVANAGREGGSLINKRNLCEGNKTYPSIRIQPRIDFILNAPDTIKQQDLIFSEVAP